MEKALLPKLWKILKTGGNGSAETIYPHLLPLLSKLNKDILNEKTLQFYTNFFENFKIGLSSRVTHATSSRAEVTAIATAYYECLQFVVIQLRSSGSLGNPEEIKEFCTQLVQTHVIDTIGMLLENSASHNGKFVLARIILLIQFWTQNASDNDLYTTLVNYFWSSLFAVVDKSFSAENDNVAHRLDLTFDLIQYLRSRNAHKSKVAKVKFNLDETNDEVDCVGVTEAERNVPLETELSEFALKLCKMYVKKISETTNSVFINHLENLLKIFGNGEFYSKLSADVGNISKLYDKFACWLLVSHLRQENVVDLILMLYPHLNASERAALLTKLIKFPNATVQNWTLSRILSHPLCVDPDVVLLISQQNISDLLLKAARAVVENTATDINLMHKCFFQNESGDILIDSNTCEQLIDILSEPLGDDAGDEVLDTCASFLAQIMPVICSDEKKKSIQTTMFLNLFRLSCNKQKSANLSEDTLWEVVTSWQDALSSRDIRLDDVLLNGCADIIHKNLSLSFDDDTLAESLEAYAEIVSKLTLCSVEHFEEADEEKYRSADNVLSTIFNRFRDGFGQGLTQALQICTFVEALNGNLITDPSSQHLVGFDLGKIDFDDVVTELLKLAFFKFCVVSKATCNIKEQRKALDSTAESADEEYTEDFCDLDESLLKKWSKLVTYEIMTGIKISSLGNTLLGLVEVRFSCSSISYKYYNVV